MVSADVVFITNGSLLTAPEKCCTTSFWPPWLQMRTLLSFILVFFLEMVCLFSLASFKYFFVFSFQKLDHDVFQHGILYLGLYYLGFIQLLESVRLCLLSNWGCFQPSFLKYFQPQSFTSFFQRFQGYKCWIFFF